MTIALYPEEAVIVGSTITYSADEITLHLTGTMFGLKAGIGTPHQFLRMNAGGTEAAWETVTVATTSAKYILQQADGSLPQAQSLGALTTGILKNTVTGTTGTLSTATAGTDYIASINAGSGLQITGGGSPTLSVSPSVVSSVTTNAAGTSFSANISSNLLTISLPDASAAARGVVNTGGQNFRGDKNLLGSFLVTNDGTTSTSLLNITNNYGVGDCVVSSFYAPYLSDNSSVSYSLGFQEAVNDRVVTSFTKTEAGSPNNYYKVELDSSGFGIHLTKNTTRIGSTGTGPLAGVGRTGSDGFDGVFPAWEFNTDSFSYYGFLNISTSIDADTNPLGILAFSTYADAITDGFHIGGAIWGTGDYVNDGHLYGSLVFNVNAGGGLSEVLRLKNERAIMTPQMPTVDPSVTLAGYDQSCIAMQYNFEPNATLGPFVTGADKFSSWWQRVGNIVTCYVKWKVSVDSVNAGDMIQWYCDLPSNITGISLANTDDVCGHVTFFKTPCFNSGTVIAADSQHVQFSVMCLQSVVNDTYQVTSSWSYVINA